MERQTLKTLFLWDLHSNGNFRFSWLTFYGIVVAGFVFTLLQSWLMSGNPLFGYRVLFYSPEVWIAFGAVGALLAFKREKD